MVIKDGRNNLGTGLLCQNMLLVRLMPPSCTLDQGPLFSAARLVGWLTVCVCVCVSVCCRLRVYACMTVEPEAWAAKGQRRAVLRERTCSPPWADVRLAYGHAIQRPGLPQKYASKCACMHASGLHPSPPLACVHPCVLPWMASACMIPSP